MYKIHEEQSRKIFPCVFALLPNKSEAIYTKFFREFVNAIGANRPADILLDFEHSTAFKTSAQTQQRKDTFTIFALMYGNISSNTVCIQCKRWICLRSLCFVHLRSCCQKKMTSKLDVKSFETTLKITQTNCWITLKYSHWHNQT